MRWMTLCLILSTASIRAGSTTRPSADDLRPRYSGPVAMAPARVRAAAADQALSHYVYTQPVPYFYWGYGYGFGGCYGWGGCFYPRAR